MPAAHQPPAKGHPRAVLVLPGVLALVLLALVGYRHFKTRAPAPPHRVAPPMLADPLLNHVFPANLDVACADVTNIYDVDARGCRLVTNAHRFKSLHPVAMPKPPGTQRVFFVGDSFVEGMCDDRLTMPDQVERFLRADPRATRRGTPEVVNAGVSSYSVIAYYLLITRRLAALAPDVIVINVDLTDVYDDEVYARHATFDGRGDPVAIGTLGRETPQQDIVRADPLGWARPGPPEALRARVDWSMRLLGRAIAAARAAGARVVVSTTPHAGQFASAGTRVGGALTDAPGRRVRSAAEAAGALYFDALGALGPRFGDAPERFYLLPHDNHFNIRGNEAWARAFADFLLAHADALFAPAPGS